MGQQFGKTWVGTLVSANVLDFACSFLLLFTLVCLPLYLQNSPFVCLTPRLSASQVGTVARQVSREEYGQGRGDGWMERGREGGREVGGMDRWDCVLIGTKASLYQRTWTHSEWSIHWTTTLTFWRERRMIKCRPSSVTWSWSGMKPPMRVVYFLSEVTPALLEVA